MDVSGNIKDDTSENHHPLFFKADTFLHESRIVSIPTFHPGKTSLIIRIDCKTRLVAQENIDQLMSSEIKMHSRSFYSRSTRRATNEAHTINWSAFRYIAWNSFWLFDQKLWYQQLNKDVVGENWHSYVYIYWTLVCNIDPHTALLLIYDLS